jgi:hypothetical protein
MKRQRERERETISRRGGDERLSSKEGESDGGEARLACVLALRVLKLSLCRSVEVTQAGKVR